MPEVLLRLLFLLLFAGESSIVSLEALGFNLRLRPLASTSALAELASWLVEESMVAVTTFCKNAFCLAANSGSLDREDLLEATGSGEGLKKVEASFYLHSQYRTETDRADQRLRGGTARALARGKAISPGSTRLTGFLCYVFYDVLNVL